MNDQARKLRQLLGKDVNIAKTISVVSGKGGVGKSNTSLNFALQLTENNYKVLLVDLDIGMGNIDILVDNDAKHSIADLFEDFVPIGDIMEIGPNNLKYIAGGTSLEELVRLQENQLQFFFGQLEIVLRQFDYIIFDLGAGVSDASLAFILASDECIVLTTPEPTAITDAYSMMKHILQRNHALPIHMVINRCKNNREGIQTMTKFTKVVKHFLQKDILPLGTLPEDPIVSTAVIQQTPYTILNDKAPASKAMMKIVQTFIGNEFKGIDIQEKQSFINTLKKWIGRG